MGNRHIQAYKPANPARAHAPMPGWDRGDDKGPSAARTNGNRVIAQRVGQLYADASVAMRRRLLESLLRPLSIYALITVANGLFARIKAGNAEWQGFRLREEDIGEVDAQDVVELVELALQENNDAALDLSIAIGSVSESAHANELVQRMHDLAQRIAAAF